MRITIDIDGKETITSQTAVVAASTSTEMVDGGPAADSTQSEVSVENVGGPPEWLIEAMNQSAAEGNSIMTEGDDLEDAGHGPV